MAAHTIMFGTFETPINKVHLINASSPTIQIKPSTVQVTPIVAPVIRTVDPWEKFDAMIEKRMQRQDNARVCINKYGTYYYKPYSARQLQKMTKERAEREAAEVAFQTAGPFLVTKISIGGGPLPSEQPQIAKRKLHKTASAKVRVIKPTVKMSKAALDNLYCALKNVISRSSATLEIIGKRGAKPVKLSIRKYDGTKMVHVTTKHEEGIKNRKDLSTNVFQGELISKLVIATHNGRMWDASTLQKGTSGMCIPTAQLVDLYGRTYDDYIIVRGRCDGRLIDARSKLTESVMNRMHHYSNSELFWKGFEKKFVENREPRTDHVCSPDFPVEKCGEVAGLVCTVLFPSWKITCAKCIGQLSLQTQEEFKEQSAKMMNRVTPQLHSYGPAFQHVINHMNTNLLAIPMVNPNVDAFNKIIRTIGHQKESPFSHVLKLNAILVKGTAQTVENLSEASDHLLEIARYLQNRTENIKNGSLTSFRNKISAKAHVNMVLMCDNQLDKNGNFVWGLRGYHAKRFFNNYFEVIDVTKGYSQYVVRKNPNGSRKLAIGNLIVSTNFTTFREQLQGERIPEMPLTKSCVSMINGNYKYPCCCVTLDDGTPLASELKAPTKNHLVLGNTGDAKYLDLPADISDSMYISKPGYCYLNIFLAMLVNVDEAQAKEFTKMVRDVIIPKLGSWPTMLDVATACNLLSVFFPATASAELPRILVDHNTQTMHVLDSYGSLQTGFHILKANTISQLNQFASDEMDSEMKHYIVGGLKVSNEFEAIRTLVQGIYRPKLMKEILETEPHLLVLSVLSPSVIIALHNSGALETGLMMYMHNDPRIATVLALVASLANKVTVARTLVDQMKILNETSTLMLESTFVGTYPSHSYMTAINVLRRTSARSETNKDLLVLGFELLTKSTIGIVEKSYINLLEESWSGLSWLEKFYLMRHSWRSYRPLTKSVHPKGEADLGGRYDVSPVWLVKRILNNAKLKVSRFLDTCKNRASRVARTAYIKVVCFPLRMLPDFIGMINILIAVGVIMQIYNTANAITLQHKALKRDSMEQKEQVVYRRLKKHLKNCEKMNNIAPTREELLDYCENIDQECYELLKRDIEDKEMVNFQGIKEERQTLESVIAFVSMVIMLFDAERSDYVFRTLTKIRTLMTTMENGVVFQSLDEINNSLEEKNLTIDFNLDTDAPLSHNVQLTTFKEWWENQLINNRVVPHYRTEGLFMEFTRDTAAICAHNIVQSQNKDFLIRGAVGSGKSTSLPQQLSLKGRVLLLEPTRPLAENVARQLRGDPFFLNPTLRMRGLSLFGSSPLSVMTSGFALQFYANNMNQLKDFDFIIFDECHVNDPAAIAFRNLLYECTYAGKLIKCSATPPGREIEFATQHPVTLHIEEQLSFSSFVLAQGTGSNADMLQHGVNLLVYVASYNEVDQLSAMLNERNYKVTKVDGRTMKTGNIEIVTSGTKLQPHFVVATNIIENGVTLNIDVVIDFGLKVVPFLDVDNRSMAYNKVSISFGERIQRLGRVGRTKEGHALRIGETIKGIVDIPTTTATEAAFFCFIYGLPVTTNSVSTTLLNNITLPQARTMNQFELSPYYMAGLVKYNGAMHPAIEKLLKVYKFRDSEVFLESTAIPSKVTATWMSGSEYERVGIRCAINKATKIPFYSKDVPDKLHEEVWDAVCKHKNDAGFGTLNSAQACKIAYTLQTDINSLPRTIKIIDQLIINEHRKQQHFQAVSSHAVETSAYSLAGIMQAIRSRYAKNHTVENILKLQEAKAQLMEFANINGDMAYQQLVKDFGYLECVHFQSEERMAWFLGLKGIWRGERITKDLLIVGGVFVGALWMIGIYFKQKITEPVHFQGSNKRQKQKLKFRDAHDKKLGRVVDNEDGSAEHYFGEAYAKKSKGKGRVRGLGRKNRQFINMYGFDPADFKYVRFVDPLTGQTRDENPYTDINLVQDEFGKTRWDMVQAGLLESEHLSSRTTINAYYVKDLSQQVLKVDLTPHLPLKVCEKANTIAGFPEREGELRQTGKAIFVDVSNMPASKEVVEFESASLSKGVRDYNPIANSICKLTNSSDGYTNTMFGIGFGSFIITNQHLFKRNNGELLVQSRHGEFNIKNTKSLQIATVPGRDLALVRMPKDFPPFPTRLQFREPKNGEKVCIVMSNFQQKHVSSMVSEPSNVYPIADSHFWKHWISTKEGHCGSPLVALADGSIVGIHSLSNFLGTNNYLAALPSEFQSMLVNPDSLKWEKGWKFNADHLSWGFLDLMDGNPTKEFKVEKLISDLCRETVFVQGCERKWMYESLAGNLIAVAQCPNQLVTKHVVKGKCILFQTYLETHPTEQKFFLKYTGEYQPSCLNREAYIKDVLKYAKPVTVGTIDTEVFENSVSDLVLNMEEWGFDTTEYVLDCDTLMSALNMKAAVGALYRGKKKEYFEGMSPSECANLIQASCKRLYEGKMGVWNGSLKAELRPLEKVKANKTRSFTAAPIDTLLGGKVCVDDFNNQFYDLNIQCPWTVGMTKFYGGWDKLLRKLPENWLYCDADGSQFDSSLSPYLINAVLQIRLHFMEEWDIGEQMLRNLYTEIVYTPIATPDGTIIKKFKGNNSGQPSTVVDNTLMVIIAVHYALNKLGFPRSNHDDICRYFVNGDDLILAVEPSHEYILDSFEDIFQELGLNYTFDSRTKNKSDLWYNSHQGKIRDGKYIPKLEEARIVSILEWDRAAFPEHRLEAICASMIEAWGYDQLLHEIRKFYAWVLEQAPYSELAKQGKAPYISELALEKLYMGGEASEQELERYLEHIQVDTAFDARERVYFQGDQLNAGIGNQNKNKAPESSPAVVATAQSGPLAKDDDINMGTPGLFTVPRLKMIGSKLTLPKLKGKTVVNLNHLLTYKPEQVDLSNTRATQAQFQAWYDGVKDDYGVKDAEMEIILNGLMVWCIENGTSPNISGTWIMMDGSTQVEYPLKPIIDHAKPSLRQIMAHFSNLAEAYIEMRGKDKPYMPRYGLQRNLMDPSLARYAFDFYEVTSKTPNRAREAHMQMKAAALRGATNRLFGLDGSAGAKEEDTERHTVDDVNKNMHTLLGVRNP